MAYMADVSRDMSGWLVWYAIPDRRAPHARLAAAAEAAGFPTAFLPAPINRKVAWKRAFMLPEAGIPVTPSSRAWTAFDDPKLSCRLRVRVFISGWMPYIRYLELEVICPGAASPEEQRRTTLVAELRLENRGHSVTLLRGPWEDIVRREEVEGVIARMEQEYRLLLETASPRAVRKAVHRRLLSLSAVLLRGTGGLYYVPYRTCPHGEELLACREFARRACGGEFSYIRLLGGDGRAAADVRTAVVESLREKLAAIHDAAVQAKSQDHDRRAETLLQEFQEAARTAARIRTSLRNTIQELDDLLALAKQAVAAL